jgi:hypothetical protein
MKFGGLPSSCGFGVAVGPVRDSDNMRGKKPKEIYYYKNRAYYFLYFKITVIFAF